MITYVYRVMVKRR